MRCRLDFDFIRVGLRLIGLHLTRRTYGHIRDSDLESDPGDLLAFPFRGCDRYLSQTFMNSFNPSIEAVLLSYVPD